MFFAVPATIRIAISIFLVFKSGSFVAAISCNWAVVIEPTIDLLGSPEPFGILAAFVRRTEAGGVFSMKE